ncbi:calponin homology domain-containing protein, partial [Pelagophyceae sp. CCMP2097]
PIAEALAQHWVEQVTGHVFRGAFGVELKDGVLLCRLVNEISAGAAPEPYVGRTEFRQMQNVSNFLAAARRFGVAPHDSFDTIDLFELKDLTGVVHCLAALSKAIQTS